MLSPRYWGGVIICGIVILLNQNNSDITPEENIPPIPTISSGSSEEVTQVLQYLQNYSDTLDDGSSAEKLEATNKVAEKIVKHGDNSKYRSQIILAQIMYYVAGGYYDAIVAASANVNVNTLPTQQKLSYYNCLALAYQALGNKTKAEEYFNLTYETSVEMYGVVEYGAE